MPFTPPPNAQNSFACPGEGWQSHGWRLLDAWRLAPGRAWNYTQLSKALGCAQGALTHWKNGGRPNDRAIEAAEKLAGVDREAWVWWLKLEALETPRETSPSSDKRPDAAELPELKGTPAERLRTLESWLETHARGGGLSTDRHRAVTTLLSSLQAQVRAKPIPDLHEHPDYEQFVTLILGAVAKYPGAAKAIIAAVRTMATEAEAA